MVLSSITYLSDKVLAQRSSTTPYCIQHYQPENSCYEMKEVIRINNGSFTPQTVTDLSYDYNTKRFTITFDQHFLNVNGETLLDVTILEHCHEETQDLHLTVKDLECGHTCTTEPFQQIVNSVTIDCRQGNISDAFMTGNQIVIAFMPNRTIQSCKNLSVNLVLVDTDGKLYYYNKATHVTA